MILFRSATDKDHGLVVQMLGELVVELGPLATADRVRPRLPEDIHLALASPDIHIVIATATEDLLAEIQIPQGHRDQLTDGGLDIGLGRADILRADPIFRLRDDQRCGYVDQMYVRPPFRGRGIGTQLLAQCEAWFREQGILHCLLHAAPAAVNFYSRHGYQPNREMFKRL